MAKFTIREVEGMRQVRLDIDDEVVRARRGAHQLPLKVIIERSRRVSP
jgi:hypothetical protein